MNAAARTLVLPVLAMLGLPAAAQNVGLVGILGDKALLVVDGSAPRAVAAGETFRGVRLVSLQPEAALVATAEHTFTVRLGDAPGTLGSESAATSSDATRIILGSAQGGHFYTLAQVNGNTVQAVVDTGATNVSMSVAMADGIGLNYRDSPPIEIHTANGVVPGWRIQLASVRVAGVTVYSVDASVSAGNMPYVLLGNSFLGHFQMKRTNDQMVLDKLY